MADVSSKRTNRAVLVVGALAAMTVLFGVEGCDRQSPRFDAEAPTPVPAVTAVTDAAGGQTVTLELTDLLRFEPSHVFVHPGKITVTLANSGGDPHTFEIPSLNVNTGNIPGHQQETVTFTIPKGATNIAFDCAYHTSEHMVGTLTVEGF